MATSTREKRIMTELQILKMHPDVQSYFSYESSGPDKESNNFFIYGYLLPRTDPYKYGTYKVRIKLPAEFPFRSPVLELLTYIYHPAVDNNISCPNFCIRCSRITWTLGRRIGQWLKQFVNIIDRPDAPHGTYCVKNFEALRLYEQNREQYAEQALVMVKNYAQLRTHRSIVSLKLAAKQKICKQVDFQSAKIDELLLSTSLKEYLNL